ncbi:uncharacterized protein MELLADRAFT_118577 [Melampsora larici-populina 98AG31]|uniref:VHS domain-containing protein n=1 Tax=Melampsora larici-populina (strain 98AG31 / pathotype 3-4-7) TaxID=747676 RepID=F4SAV9_MELLP|nr:uncharacterized protein MELLADRAFT_118577 [Melampsora larici-populina 98AG31]EGF98237.1 hypothetical protein MELLADRAFT_118577 [Melampsora larici-populina 98AG31]
MINSNPKKKAGFLSRFQTKSTHHTTFHNHHHQQQPSSEIQRCVSWLCSLNQLTEDWSKILEVCDKLSKSEDDCKEAVHLLRKELKHGIPSVQVQAIRLTVIFVLNSSDRLRLQIASKKFLETVEEVFHKSNKDPTRFEVREMIRKSFSLLGYEFQHDGDLQAFTHLYNKIKPSDSPMGGAPLDESDHTFTPTSKPRSSNQSNHLHHSQQAVAPVMRDLKAEAEVARSNARLLIEALAYTTPAEMENNELIQEFHSKCLHHQNQLLDDIPWATAQAEQSRLYASSITTSHPLPATNPYAPLLNGVGTPPDPSSGLTKEEELLNVLLLANSDLVDGFRQYDEMSKLLRNEKQMKIVEERSKLETRREVNQEGEGEEGFGGGGGGSGASSSEPMKSTFALRSPLGSRNPFGEEIRKQEGYRVEVDEERETRSSADLSNQPERKKKEWITNGNGNGITERTMVEEPDEFEEEVGIPKRFEPSEKALGKMRRISGLDEDGMGSGSGSGKKETDESNELRRRREEVEKTFRDRYRLFHEKEEN